jgi:1,4-alpha-glucan branching enzyme
VEQDAGIYEDKFSNLKAGYTYMTAHPGKKLLFMGQISDRPESGARRGKSTGSFWRSR